MFKRTRRQLRSWMIIYAGFVAAIVVANNSPDAGTLASEATPQPVITSAAPIARRDI